MEALSPPTEASYRSTFRAWLDGLGSEAEAFSRLLEQEDAPEPLRRFGADALNQLLHSLDLIPEGIEALGYLEDVFAFRILAQQLCEEQPEASSGDPSGTLARLAAEAALIGEFLGSDDYARLCAIVQAERERLARGRRSQDLLEAAEAREAALSEARAFHRSYRAPEFGQGPEDLIKLSSFLRTRVRRAS